MDERHFRGILSLSDERCKVGRREPTIKRSDNVCQVGLGVSWPLPRWINCDVQTVLEHFDSQERMKAGG